MKDWQMPFSAGAVPLEPAFFTLEVAPDGASVEALRVASRSTIEAFPPPWLADVTAVVVDVLAVLLVHTPRAASWLLISCSSDDGSSGVDARRL